MKKYRLPCWEISVITGEIFSKDRSVTVLSVHTKYQLADSSTRLRSVLAQL